MNIHQVNVPLWDKKIDHLSAEVLLERTAWLFCMDWMYGGWHAYCKREDRFLVGNKAYRDVVSRAEAAILIPVHFLHFVCSRNSCKTSHEERRCFKFIALGGGLNREHPHIGSTIITRSALGQSQFKFIFLYNFSRKICWMFFPTRLLKFLASLSMNLDLYLATWPNEFTETWSFYLILKFLHDFLTFFAWGFRVWALDLRVSLQLGVFNMLQ